MVKKLFSILFVLPLIAFLFCSSAHADTLTLKDEIVSPRGTARGIRMLEWTYNNASGTTLQATASNAATNVTGFIIGAKHEPDTADAPPAGADYQVWDGITSGATTDVLFGAGANIGTTRTTVFPDTTVNDGTVSLVNETLYFYIGELAGGGAEKGVFKVYILLP